MTADHETKQLPDEPAIDHRTALGRVTDAAIVLALLFTLVAILLA